MMTSSVLALLLVLTLSDPWVPPNISFLVKIYCYTLNHPFMVHSNVQMYFWWTIMAWWGWVLPVCKIWLLFDNELLHVCTNRKSNDAQYSDLLIIRLKKVVEWYIKKVGFLAADVMTDTAKKCQASALDVELFCKGI